MQEEIIGHTTEKRLYLPLLVALGIWSIAVPYLGPLLGLILDVPAKLEVVDHVVPGVVVVASSVVLLLRGIRETGRYVVVLLGVTALPFLAGLWMTSTHVPLLFQAAEGLVPWGTALFHSAPGPFIMLLSLLLLMGALKSVED